MTTYSSQSTNETIKDLLRKLSLEGVVNFSVGKDNNSTFVLIHFEPLKRVMKYFITFMMIIGVPIIITVPASIITKLISLLILPIIFFLQNRIYIKIIKYNDGRIEVIKQGSFIKKVISIQSNTYIHVLAQQRNWIGNRYFGDNAYELVIVYIDDAGIEKRISGAFDDRKFLFQGGRNNIKGILKKEEIQQIAKELELPYSVNNS